MTTPTRPLPPGVEIREFAKGWHAIWDFDESGFFRVSRLDGRKKLCDFSLIDSNQGFDSEADATAAFWAWHDKQPENQPKGEVRREPPGYIDGVLDGMDLCKPIITSLAEQKKELTARVAALEAKSAPLPSPSAEVPHREPVVGMVYRIKDAAGTPASSGRWLLMPNGEVKFNEGTDDDPRWEDSGTTGMELRSFVASGYFVPVPGYKVEVTP